MAPDKDHILIICMGNTCRSPMAEAIAHNLLGNSVHVESAGLETADGLPATKDAIAAMREMGLDLTRHRSQDIHAVDLGQFGPIVAMTPVIAERLIGRGVAPERIVQLDVPDPYGRGLEVYRSTAKEIECRLRSVFGLSNES